MARRKQRSQSWKGIILAVGLVVAAFVGAVLFFPGDTNPYRTSPDLDAKDYLENANSLRGNVYRVEGEVANQLENSPASGRLIAVEMISGHEVLPVLVPPEFNHMNIQKGQRFYFLLEVGAGGILKTKNLIKS